MRSEIKLLRRNLGHLFHLNMNRLRNRTFVPHPRSHFFIEPASYCNLACKFCSHDKHLRPRRIMPTADFICYVDQAVEMGYGVFVLTPMSGDVFMDRDFQAKLEYLEAKDGVDGIAFYTNLIGASAKQISYICGMKKLRLLEISVYGHDLASFQTITTMAETQYRRLLVNLSHLL
ncbi:MAG: radical SAM protein, partial [Alphaproteobacteria bacterium]